LHDHRLHLSYTEDSLLEALALVPEAAYDRCQRIADFAESVGNEWFTVSMGLNGLIDHELEFSDKYPAPKFPHYTEELRRRFFSHLQSREAFEEWHRTELAEHRAWSNAKGRLEKDRADNLRGLSYEQFLERHPDIAAQAEADGEDLRQHHDYIQRRLSTPASTQELLVEEMHKIPTLASNWAVEKLVAGDALRARVTPELCPTLAALAGGYSLNRCGATLGIEKSWQPYGWLYPELNDYTDVRIIAQGAYANVLVSKDQGLGRRAKLLQELGLFRPEVMTWDALLARPLS
jgi:hypothetical protein